MNKVSPKRLEKIASGKVKLNHGSTIKQMSVEEFREKRDKGNKALLAALRGDGGGMSSSVVDRVFGRVKRANKSDRSKAMKAADKWFSEWIRLRDSDENGRGKCVTCTHWGRWQEMDCGHWISRKEHATRYDEQNCALQCGGCNGPGKGKPFDFAQAIDVRWGPEARPQLELKILRWRKDKASMKTRDFQFRADTYKARVENMRQQSPGKFTS